jgi:glutamate/tyrosine decarboxylase-like PLP-dependent enzyme
MVLFGLGSNSTRWIETPVNNQMDVAMLQDTIEKDLAEGNTPMMVVGTAGDVSTGAVDDLKAIGRICKKYGLWFHIDGAYGMPAAAVPHLKNMFEGLEDADSIAIDPHKWLYSPIEAGCTLVKDPNHLIETFSSHPVYYNFETAGEGKPQNFYEYGLQNSRGFRALKVWLMLQQVGREGYIKMISDDIGLSQLMFSLASGHPSLEALTQNLSITTLRYVPEELDINDESARAKYLNELNEALLNDIQSGGEVFLSNAMVGEKYCLRACIVNFRTSETDIYKTVEIIAREGNKVHHRLKNEQSTTA